MRSIARVMNVSIMTVMKLAVDAGEVCVEYHDKAIRKIKPKRVECDEAWAFCYAKRKTAKTLDIERYAGDVWSWIAIDSDTKLAISLYVSPGRSTDDAKAIMLDLRSRTVGRYQLSTDSYFPYLEAVEFAFGSNVDYGTVTKYLGDGDKSDQVVGSRVQIITGSPEPSTINTSYVERFNLTTRMSLRRHTRKTNGFSKKLRNHVLAMYLYYVWYNFCRSHISLGGTPAMAAGLEEFPKKMEWIVDMIDAKAKNERKNRRLSSI